MLQPWQKSFGVTVSPHRFSLNLKEGQKGELLFVLVFETESCDVAQVSIRLILLSLTPQSENCRHESQHLSQR